MPDGELRRPPQLWEQRLARTTSILGVGISSSGDATSIVTPTPPPGAGGGTEPAPVLPPPGDFIKPSTPQLIGAVQGINVLWDGLNDNGDLWPYDTSYIEVHMDTSGTAFTPGTATLQGRLARPGGLYVGGLAAGTTYYFRLRGADPAGNVTDPSDAASGLTGLTTASDYGTATIGSGAVSFDARAIGGITTTVGTSQPSSPNIGDIWLDTTGGNTTHKRWDGSSWVTQAWSTSSIGANVITATQIAAGAITAGAIAANAVTTEKLNAGAITADKIAALTITGDKIAASTISADKISAAFITASDVNGNVTSISGSAITTGTVAAARIDVANLVAEKVTSGPFSSRRVVIGGVGETDAVAFKGASTSNGWLMAHNSGNNNLSLTSTYSGVTFEIYKDVAITGGLTASAAAVEFIGVYNNNTTGLDEVGITSAGRLRRLSSSQDIKYDITPLTQTLSESVDPGRVTDVVTVDPQAVLDVAVTEFSVVDNGEPTERRVLGFIADDVADKLPIAVTRYDDGRPAGVLNTSMLAAVLAVVQEQAQQIQDLRSRIEALEA